jgi:NAD(P)-dependent dehydrogenase (short-subunit alcohol dehydrogenase family)
LAGKVIGPNRFSLEGRTALITGASSGLGRHFALTLAAAGAKVAIAARRSDRLEALAAEIHKAGGVAVPLELDVTQPAAVVAAFDKATAALGGLDVVVNNAGVPSNSWFLKTSEDEWRQVMAVNLDGVFRVGQEAARRMKASGKGGSIINIASILGFVVSKTLSPYCASKAAVISLTKSMALELARDKIRVNALAPGYFPTEMNDGYFDGPAGQKLLTHVPMGRAGDMRDIEGPLLLLASDAGAFMTGSVITVDGGHVINFG